MASCCLLPYWSNAHTDTLVADNLEPGREHDIMPRRLWKALKDEAIALITGALYDQTGTLATGLILAGLLLCVAGFLTLLIPQHRR